MDGELPTIAVGSGEANVQSPHGPDITTTAQTSSTVWGTAFEQWREVQLKEQLVHKWDAAFSSVVGFKEGTAQEKHRLVQTVKDFAAVYRTEPSLDKVENLLKFFKKFIGALFERVEVSEAAFIAMYQAISMAPDPAPLLLAAHVEVCQLSVRIHELEQEVVVRVSEADKLRRSHDAALREVLPHGRGASGSTASTAVASVDAIQMMAQELKELRGLVDDLNHEKRQLVEMVRHGELQLTAAKDDVARLSEERRSLSHQLLRSQTRYEEAVARAERDSSALLEELTEAHERLRDLESHRGGEGKRNGQDALLISALEGEVAALRVALVEATATTSAAASNSSAVAAAVEEKHEEGSISGKHSMTDAGALALRETALHREASQLLTMQNELAAQLAAERRQRREAELRADASEKHVTELYARLEALEALQRQTSTGNAGLSSKSHLTAEPPAPLPPVKSTDALIAELVGLDASDAAPSSSSMLPSSNSDGTSGDAVVLQTVCRQREQLRVCVSQLASRNADLEQEVVRLRADVVLLQRNSIAAPGSPHSAADSSRWNDPNYKTAVLASVGSSSSAAASATSGVGADGTPTAIDIGGGEFGPSGGPRRRRKMLQQTVRRAADSVAVVIAQMVVHSATTRLALVLYLVGLHVVVLLSTYVMAFRGTTCRSSTSASKW